jgi:hypothetical protein
MNNFYQIGHRVYKGPNAAFECKNPHRAVMELISRGVAASDARQAIRAAGTYPYPHTTTMTANGLAVIEVIFRTSTED